MEMQHTSTYLIDGTAYIYRAFHAIAELKNSAGFPTNAIYGFTAMMFKFIKDKAPDAIAVVLDSPEPTHRHKLYTEYKANRSAPAEDFIMQIEPITAVLAAMNIAVIALPGFESDDIMAVLAKRYASATNTVYIVTGDKDLLQAVDTHIKIYDLVKNVVLDIDSVISRLRVPPVKVPELMALTGDQIDNIPGVRGIGEKTAADLLKDYDTVEELIAHCNNIPNARLRKMIEDNVPAIRLSRELSVVSADVPLDIPLSQLMIKEPHYDELKALFIKYEFTSLLKYIPDDYEDFSFNRAALATAKEFNEAFKEQPAAVSIKAAPDGGDSCALSIDANMGYSIRPTQLAADILTDNSIAKIGHNLKSDIHVFHRHSIGVRGNLYDTMVAANLINPNRQDYSLRALALEYLSYKIKGENKELDLYSGPPVEEAVTALRLQVALSKKIEGTPLARLYEKVEAPLIYILAEMEQCGIRVDTVRLKALSDELGAQVSALEKRIYFLAGEEFNINSPKQLSEILFDKLRLTSGKKTKTGLSTDVGVLETLADHHPLPAEILQYRTLAKLKNTYADALPTYINPATGRLHTTFNQAGTSTGRLSSSNPNLQNIPVRGALGEAFRRAFIAGEGHYLVSADYSQIELRVLAHLSGDEGFIEAFSNGADIHTETAREVLTGADGVVTGDMRRQAKAINFGIIYGMSAFGLAGQLKIPQSQTKQYIERFFQRYEGVSRFIDSTIKETTTRGYAQTIMGRRRPIDGLKSGNKNIRQQAERLAINSPIQGSAADIIKLSMLKVHAALSRFKTKMILQIHDELLFEVPEAELDDVKALVRQEMENVLTLDVALKVDIGAGLNWADTKV
ncbi:DNA polymerase I [Candidatus Magnetominusculus xianensis]|uniref:DNA polymerase I n=1 Tax=Candidatus Magnetominusculus xianensis TaxID=1748249 RepID=A0ABR5SLM6_9BACT|nr:DNA polymerase I [Candidatus Magnetominusculus xianensis]KWT91803.1 DNA polymerase I [Candidatus Magnetominusculus xianensis]MBF0403859.1 DNA polymerase I [Nitrospirota bacterium]